MESPAPTTDVTTAASGTCSKAAGAAGAASDARDRAIVDQDGREEAVASLTAAYLPSPTPTDNSVTILSSSHSSSQPSLSFFPSTVSSLLRHTFISIPLGLFLFFQVLCPLVAMFDYFAMVLSSVASFLFPIFASYKALKTSDPAQLTPWLMYWVVFSCCLLFESWFGFILFWIPLYGYVRLVFFLYLILPQTQGARIIYEDQIHPFLESNEAQIDEFIVNAHDKLKKAGLAYLKSGIEYLKVKVLGLPPTEPTPEPQSAAPQSYTQSLLARFSVPTARWAGTTGAAAATNAGNDLYTLLAAAVSTATAAAGGSNRDNGASTSSLIPASLQDTSEKMTFIAAQRERLSILLSALDKEAHDIQQDAGAKPAGRHSRSMAFDGHEDEEPTQRPPSGLSMLSGISKSRSEVDFEKIEAESGAENEQDTSTIRKRRNVTTPKAAPTGSWMPWGVWGGASNGEGAQGDAGTSSGTQP